MTSIALPHDTARAEWHGPATPIAWTFDPWREAPTRALTAIAGTTVLILLAMTSHLIYPAVLAIAIGIVALTAPTWWPAEFRFDAAGASRRLSHLPWTTIPWPRVRTVTLHERGVLLELHGIPSLARLKAWTMPLPLDTHGNDTSVDPREEDGEPSAGIKVAAAEGWIPAEGSPSSSRTRGTLRSQLQSWRNEHRTAEQR